MMRRPEAKKAYQPQEVKELENSNKHECVQNIYSVPSSTLLQGADAASGGVGTDSLSAPSSCPNFLSQLSRQKPRCPICKIQVAWDPPSQGADPGAGKSEKTFLGCFCGPEHRHTAWGGRGLRMAQQVLNVGTELGPSQLTVEGHTEKETEEDMLGSKHFL